MKPDSDMCLYCRRLRQEPHKFEASLDCVVGLCLLRESEKVALEREPAMNMCALGCGCASAFERLCFYFSGVYLGRHLGHVISLFLIFCGATICFKNYLSTSSTRGFPFLHVILIAVTVRVICHSYLLRSHSSRGYIFLWLMLPMFIGYLTWFL